MGGDGTAGREPGGHSPIDGASARTTLWARFDAGEVTASELDGRLRAVDRAGSDPAALARAIDGPAPRTRRPVGKAALAALFAVGLVAAGAAVVDAVGGGDPSPTPGPTPAPGTIGPVGGGPGVGGIIGVEPVDCPEFDEALERFEAIDQETPAANPSLLSSPVALPEGYAFTDEETIVPGSDPDIAMSVSAGDPLPLNILARNLSGPLPVTMRAWEYESSEAAGQAGATVLQAGVCTYDLKFFDVPDRPEISGSVVSGPIPTTAFASWRLGERRFTAAVQAGVDGDPAATAAAQDLAGRIAALELDAARTEAPPG